MIRFFVAIFLALSLGAVPAFAQLSLKINGDVVAAPGDVTMFQFQPGQPGIVQVRTFFEDIRCQAVAPPPAEAASFRLDQLNGGEVLEPEAAYAIPADGKIIYHPSSGLIEITTSGIQDTADQDCYHQFLSAIGTIGADGKPSKGAFRIDDFERAFTLEVLAAANGIGFDLKLTNISELFAAKSIKVPLKLSTTASSNPPPTFSPDAQVSGETWTVPLLWPGEFALLEVRYTGLSSGDSIDMSVEDPGTNQPTISAQNRDPEAPSAPYFLPASLLTVVNTSTTIKVL